MRRSPSDIRSDRATIRAVALSAIWFLTGIELGGVGFRVWILALQLALFGALVHARSEWGRKQP